MKKSKLMLLGLALATLFVAGCNPSGSKSEMPQDMFCFTALEDGLEVSMEIFDDAHACVAPSLLYSLNGGDWSPFVAGQTVVTLPHAGDKMYMKAHEPNTTFSSDAASDVTYIRNYNSFRSTK